MRIDVILESNNSPERVKELGCLAEEYGLGGVWVSNMTDGRDPFINFVPLAMATKRIAIGAIAVSPFELHPLKMANALLTFNEFANGRAQIVVGGGGGTATAMGLEPQRRVRAVRECVEILQAASSGKPVQYEGEIYKIRWYNPSWVTAGTPMVYVGAGGPQMLRSAAKYAPGIMVSDFVVDHVRWARGLIDESMQAVGRDATDFSMNNFWAWHVKPTEEEAENEARIWLAIRGTIYPEYVETVLDADEAKIVNENIQSFIKAYYHKTPEIEGVPDEIVRKLVHGCTSACALADIDREVQRIRDFRDAGLTQIALRIYDRPDDAIRMIGEHVVPALA